MDFKQLEAFVNVVKYKSFSLAAKALFLTQPTISAHIVSLEEELNNKLLVRTTREVYPTKVGQVVYEYAEDILNMREKAIKAVKSFENSKEGELCIAVSSVPTNYFVESIMKDYRAENPNVTFKIVRGDSGKIESLVANQEVDIGFTGSGGNNSKCIYEPFAQDKLVIIAPNTPYYKSKFSKGYSIQKLLKEPFVVRRKGSGTRKVAEYMLKEAGIDIGKINIVQELPDNNSVFTKVSMGAGLAVVSNIAAEKSELKSKLLILNFENITAKRNFYAIRHKLNPLSPAGEEFYNFAVRYHQSNNKNL